MDKQIDYSEDGYTSELVIGLVGAVGVNWHDIIKETLFPLFEKFNYKAILIDVSEEIIDVVGQTLNLEAKQYDESDKKYNKAMVQMDWGNEIRKHDKYLTANAIATKILNHRLENNHDQYAPCERPVFIIKSLKNPNEIERLRQIYQAGFYVFGVYASKQQRLYRLKNVKNIQEEHANTLIERDENESSIEDNGQRTRDTFQMADFFIDATNVDNVKPYLERIINLMFGHPFITPTFGEYAMFIAHCTSLRSGDLSRQIGAAICKDNEIIATGVNDCPKFGGGLYWQKYDYTTHQYIDDDRGKDYTRGYDSNKREIGEIAKDIYIKIKPYMSPRITEEETVKQIRDTRLGALTEFGRPVHAEMEALTMCARNNISSKGADLYVTTFPCHNCTKHIISSGIKEVIYIEAYPKSKAFELFDDSITDNIDESTQKIVYRPFFGVGPRKFMEMFGMKKRKNNTGEIVDFDISKAKIRDRMPTMFYIDREKTAASDFNDSQELILKEKK